jgi:hypothetical protein
MFYRLALLFTIISVHYSFSQSTNSLEKPEGAYASYQAFEDKLPSFSVDSVLNNIIKNQFGNVIALPSSRFSNIWGIVIKDNLYVRRVRNIRTSALPSAVVPFNGGFITLSKLDVAFVRIIKYGSICLNAENEMIKLPSILNYQVSVSDFKFLIRHDRDLTAMFKKERNKKVSVYRYIDLYNARHPSLD